MLHICSIMQQHVHFSTFNIKKYKNITQLQKSMPKRATVYQLSDMLPFQLVCSKYAANMLQNQILEEAHLLISICHAKKPLYTHFHALITICSVWLILAPTILYYYLDDLLGKWADRKNWTIPTTPTPLPTTCNWLTSTIFIRFWWNLVWKFLL